MKKKHPTFTRLSASEDGTIFYENGNKVPTNKKGTREQFVVKKDGKCYNFGVRRFVWECINNKVLDKKYVVVGKNDSNHIKDLEVMTKSEHSSKVYTDIWKRKKE